MKKENKNLIKVFIGLFLSIILSGLLSIYLVFYGPLTPVRDMFVTTAMTTFSHQYLARIFLSDEKINEIMERNSIEDLTEETDTTRITGDSEEILETYKSTIRTARKANDLNSNKDEKQVELIQIKRGKFKGWLIIAKDPSKVVLGTTTRLGKAGMKLDQIVKKYDAFAGINAGGFMDDGGHGTGGTPTGIIIENYEVVYNDGSKYHSIIGFDRMNRLILGNYTIQEMENRGIRDAISFGPYLIVNGKTAINKGNGGRGIQPRTVIGQREDGAVLMLAIDGRQVSSIGATLKEAQDIMLEHGAVNAANLDGGSSTTVYYDKKIINHPCGPAGARYIPTAFIVKK